MPKKSLAIRIQDDPIYRAVIRLVGYLGTALPIGHDDAGRLSEQFGKDKVMAAAEELLDFDTAAKVARLKPGVRRLCRGLLGPAPEEWDEFYEGVENPPPNLYRQELDAIAQAVADAVREESGHECEVKAVDSKSQSRTIAIGPPNATDSEWPLADQTDKRLLELLDRNQYEMTKCKPGSVSFREALREIAFIVAEFQRRDRAYRRVQEKGPGQRR
jgi:hypothetical protein